MGDLLLWNERYGYLVWPIGLLVSGGVGVLLIWVLTRRAARLWKLTGGFILAAGIFLGVLAWLGHRSWQDADEQLSYEKTYYAAPLQRAHTVKATTPEALLATLSPFHRDDMMWRLAIAQRDHGPMTARALRRVIDLHMARGNCRAAVDVAVGHGQYDRALELAQRCDDEFVARPAMEAACANGDFAAAKKWYRRDGWDDVVDLRVHLLAGDLRRAARIARTIVNQEHGVHKQVTATLNKPMVRPRKIDNLACLAAALEARAGSDDARGRSARLARETHTEVCRLLAADLAKGEERAVLIAGLLTAGKKKPHQFKQMAALLALEAGRTDVPAAFLERGVDHALVRAALARLSPADQQATRRLQAWLRLAIARSYLESGELRSAQEQLEPVGSLVSKAAVDREAYTEYLRIETALDQWKGDLQRARERLEGQVIYPISFAPFGVLMRVRQAPQGTALDELGLPKGADRPLKQLLRAALAGDGKRMAWLVWAARVALPLEYLPYLAPLIHKGRQDLLSELRYGRRLTADCEVFTMRREIATDMAIAEAFAEKTWSKRLRERLEAQRKLLAKRQLVMALFVLHNYNYVK